MDFATGDKGGDPVSLVAYLADVSQGEAARLLAKMLGLETGGPPQWLTLSTHSRPCPTPKLKPLALARQRRNEPGARLICPPAEAESGAHAAARLYGRKPDAIWRYAMRTAKPPSFAARWNEPGGKKEIRPLSWREGEGWTFAAWPDHRPVYRLANVAATPKAPDCDLRGREGGGRGGGDLSAKHRHHVQRRRQCGGENRLGALGRAARPDLAGQ